MARKRKGDIIDGVLLLDKPSGMTSNKALQQCKFAINAQKAGHTGALDPLATGLLPLCFGQATKISSFLLGNDKTYAVSILLGQSTDTADADGTIIASKTVKVSEESAKQVLKNHIGVVDQIPPMYSALKLNGQPLYKLARKGIEVEREARRVHAYDIRFIALNEHILHFELDCSSGFYVRSLAVSIGEALQCGAHVKTLRRSKIHSIDIKDALTLDAFLAIKTLSEKRAHLLPADKFLTHLSRADLTAEQTKDLCHGIAVNFIPSSLSNNAMPDLIEPNMIEIGASDWIRIYDDAQHFLGLGQLNSAGMLAPKRLFIRGTKAK